MREGLIPGTIGLLRRHLVAAACVVAFASALAGAALSGTGPAPQGPPEGYEVVSGQVSLEWNRGTRTEPIRVELSEGDPSFAKPAFAKIVPGTSHTVTTLRPGATYYWRLVQGDRPGPVASFRVSESYVDF